MKFKVLSGCVIISGSFESSQSVIQVQTVQPVTGRNNITGYVRIELIDSFRLISNLSS